MKQPLVALPVMNGLLPRPDDGEIAGVFLDPISTGMLEKVGEGGSFILAPWSESEQNLYSVGVVGKILEFWRRPLQTPQGIVDAAFVRVRGIMHAKVEQYSVRRHVLFAAAWDELSIREMVGLDYPIISGAGWRAEGGYTEMRSPNDLPITIYGTDLQTGDRVELRGNVGGVVDQEQAHTMEHAIIRSLNDCAMCTAKTLWKAIQVETAELKRSVEIGMRYALPEVFGATQTGQCGNPMTNLAHFYLGQEVMERMEQGQSLNRSLEGARLATMSRITDELGLTTEPGLRVLQGLKKGMAHDDEVPMLPKLKKVLKRFPTDPWR